MHYTKVYFDDDTISVKRDNANDYCFCEYETQLATILSEDNNLAAQIEDPIADCKTYDRCNLWIGLNDKRMESNYTWETIDHVCYTNWANNKPDLLYSNNEDCVFMNNNGEWDDATCNSTITTSDDIIRIVNGFVCNLPCYTLTLGSVDYNIELSSNGNYYRVLFDSGYDGSTDRIDANIFCQCEFGTELATILSENANLEAMVNAGEDCNQEFGCYLWIGLNDIRMEGNFTWETNDYVNYTNWKSGHPSNASDDIDCVLLSGDGKWQSAPCDNSGSIVSIISGFICNAQ